MPFVYGLSAALAFACMNFVLKHFCEESSSMLAMLVRGMVGVVFLWPIFWQSRAIYFRRSSLQVWLRSISGAVSVVCLFVNLKQATVGDATMLANLSPVFVILIQYVFMAESLKRNEVIGTLIVVGGVVALSSPQVQGLSLPVVLTGLLGAVFAAVAYLTLKRASKTFNSRQIVWAFCLVMVITPLVFGAGSELVGEVSSFSRGLKSGMGLLWLVVAGMLGLLAQLLMTKAFMGLPAIVAASLTLSMVLWGVFFEALYIQQWPKIGAMLSYFVVLAGLLVVQGGLRRGIPSRV